MATATNTSTSKPSNSEKIESPSRGIEYVPVSPSTFGDMICFVNQLHQSKRLSDLKLTCRGKSYDVHRLVLASRSSYFGGILDSDEPINELTLDADPDIMDLCLEYLYTDTAQVDVRCAEAVADLCQELGIIQLRNDCFKYRVNFSDITPNNCLSLYADAYVINELEITDKITPVVLDNFARWESSTDFNDLTFDCVSCILSHPDLNVTSPDQRFDAALDWVRANLQARQPKLHSLLEKLPFHRRAMKVDPILQNNPRVRSLLNNVIDELSQTHKHGVIIKVIKSSNDDDDDDFNDTLVFLNDINDHNDADDNDDNDDDAEDDDDDDDEEDDDDDDDAEEDDDDDDGDDDDDVEQRNIYVIVIPVMTSFTQPSRSITTIPAPVPCDGVMACCMSEDMLYVSGVGDDKRGAWQCDMNTVTWRACGKLAAGREGHCMCVSEGSVYVIGGGVLCSRNVVRSVEVMVSGSVEWSVAGHMPAAVCVNTCCCTLPGGDILVYGMWGEGRRLTLQVFSVSTHSVTHTLTTPNMGFAYGVLVTHDHIIMFSSSATLICPVSVLYKTQSGDIQIRDSYQTPNHLSAVFLSEDHTHIISVGGFSRDKTSPHYVYRASATDVIGGTGSGWERVMADGVLGRCIIEGGAVCSGLIPLSLFK